MTHEMEARILDWELRMRKATAARADTLLIRDHSERLEQAFRARCAELALKTESMRLLLDVAEAIRAET